MAWTVKPIEIADENRRPCWRLAVISDDGRQVLAEHDHASAEGATQCEQCSRFAQRILLEAFTAR